MESSASPHNRRVHFIVAGFALFNVLLHLIFYDQLGFHRDELLYFSYGKHPQLGYFAVPPLIGWLATILGHTIGFKLFAIRLLPALIGGGMMFLAAGIVREMGGKTFAKVLACTAVLCAPLFTRAWFLFQPVPFDIFFWTLIFYFLLRYVNDQQDITLYWLGLAVGLGLLNKYLVALPLTGLFLFLPFTSYRTLFRKRAFYLSLLIAFLVFLPNLFWQWQNDFPGLDHYAELNDTQLQFLSRWTLVLEQFLTYLTGFVLAMIGLGFLLLHREAKNWRIVGWTALFVFTVLFYLKGKSYYTAGIYPVLMAAGSVFLEKIIRTKVPQLALISLFFAIAIPILPFGIPTMPPHKLAAYFDQMEAWGIDAGRIHEDGEKHALPQDYADMIGWDEIVAHVKTAWDMVEDKESCLIFGEGYWEAGAVTVMGDELGLPEARSFAGSFAYWVPRSYEPDIQSFIYINDGISERLRGEFDDITEIGRITNPIAREYGTQIYLCQKPKRSFNAFWAEVLARVEADE